MPVARHGSCARRLVRAGCHLDHGSPARQVSQRRPFNCDAWPQRRLRLFGCTVPGWISCVEPGRGNPVAKCVASTLPRTAINTLLCGSAAIAATFAVTRIRFGKPDASLCANGWMSGLVVHCMFRNRSPPLHCLSAWWRALPLLLVEVLELALSIDDPSGAISVHLSRDCGVSAAGMFAPQRGQMLAQFVA